MNGLEVIYMKTLFIDTHSDTLRMALLSDNIEEIIKSDTRNHSEIAIPTLQELLTRTNIELKDIDEIIVVNGPGSFTGVRIGITIAKTIAYSLQIPIKTITSLEALGESIDDKFDIITVSDTKGFYSAKKEGKNYTDFEYRKNSEFEEYIKSNNYKTMTTDKYNYQNIINYLKEKPYTNPHAVNPIYIKEIDALK